MNDERCSWCDGLVHRGDHRRCDQEEKLDLVRRESYPNAYLDLQGNIVLDLGDHRGSGGAAEPRPMSSRSKKLPPLPPGPLPEVVIPFHVALQAGYSPAEIIASGVRIRRL